MKFSVIRQENPNTFSGIKTFGTPNALSPYSIYKSNTQHNVGSVESTGPTGPTGPEGPEGVGIESIYNVEDGIIINLTNGISDFVDLKSITGPTGNNGPTGPTGPIGGNVISFVRASSNRESLIFSTPVIFKFDSIDEGNLTGYNTSNGKFTVPVSGIYNISSVFSIKLKPVEGIATLELLIYDNVVQQRNISQDIDTENTFTMDINYTTSLNLGDEVHISLYGFNAEYGLTNRQSQQLNIIRLA
tara:strand:- start:59 stop:793 length:735 start_codon:yes stop_codon:yes gene_type:complete